MSKKYFEKNDIIRENLVKKKYSQYNQLYPTKNVDINMILNRVKIDKKKDIKKKLIFYSLTTFIVCLLGTLISIIK